MVIRGENAAWQNFNQCKFCRKCDKRWMTWQNGMDICTYGYHHVICWLKMVWKLPPPKILTNMYFLLIIWLKPNLMWHHSITIPAYGLHHAIHCWTQRWKMPLEKILTDAQFLQETWLEISIPCRHNELNFNHISCENYTLVKIFSKVQILYLIF